MKRQDLWAEGAAKKEGADLRLFHLRAQRLLLVKGKESRKEKII
jgi:hypothetical protein